MPEEKTITEQAREHIAAMRHEALHGDHRRALAMLLDSIETGMVGAAAMGVLEAAQAGDLTGTA